MCPSHSAVITSLLHSASALPLVAIALATAVQSSVLSSQHFFVHFHRLFRDPVPVIFFLDHLRRTESIFPPAGRPREVKRPLCLIRAAFPMPPDRLLNY